MLIIRRNVITRQPAFYLCSLSTRREIRGRWNLAEDTIEFTRINPIYSVPVFVSVSFFFFLFSRSRSALHKSGLSQCSGRRRFKKVYYERGSSVQTFHLFPFFFFFFFNPPSLLARVKLERLTDKVECASDDCDIILLLASFKD